MGTAWRKSVDLVVVAQSERWLCRSLLLAIIGVSGILFLSFSFGAALLGGVPTAGLWWMKAACLCVLLVGVIGTMAGLIRLSLALHTSPAVMCLFVFLLLVPLLGLIVACMQCAVGRHALREAGVKVGLLGVSSEEMKKLVEGVCRQCGYDMRTLAGRACPECGAMAGSWAVVQDARCGRGARGL